MEPEALSKIRKEAGERIRLLLFEGQVSRADRKISMVDRFEVLQMIQVFQKIEDPKLYYEIKKILDEFSQIRLLLSLTGNQSDLLITDHIPIWDASEAWSEWVLICQRPNAGVIRKAFIFGAFDVIIDTIDLQRLRCTIEAFLQWDRSSKRQYGSHSDSLNQETLDQIRLQRISWLQNWKSDPEGYNVSLLQKILLALQEVSPNWQTISDLEKSVAVSKTTLRKYLEQLEERKRILSRVRYGKGRPSREYRIIGS